MAAKRTPRRRRSAPKPKFATKAKRFGVTVATTMGTIAAIKGVTLGLEKVAPGNPVTNFVKW